jgi:hypothetical protein
VKKVLIWLGLSDWRAQFIHQSRLILIVRPLSAYKDSKEVSFVPISYSDKRKAYRRREIIKQIFNRGEKQSLACP